MKIILIIFALFVGYTTNLWAALQTDTHTYIVSRSEGKVLSIDRKTGVEKIINIGKGLRSMIIHGDYGYALCGGNKVYVVIIELKTHTISRIIDINKGEPGLFPKPALIYGSYAYIVGYPREAISVIDLTTHKLHTIPMGEYPRSLLFHNNFGYVLNCDSTTVSVIDLQTHRVTQTLNVIVDPRDMEIHGDYGYVSDSKNTQISVINLRTNTVDAHLTFPYESLPSSILFKGHYGYVLHKASDTVSVLDLGTHTVTQTITLGSTSCCNSMMINGDLGYVVSWGKVTVIDLNTHRVTKTISVSPGTEYMEIYGDYAYVMGWPLECITTLDLTSHSVIRTLDLGNRFYFRFFHGDAFYLKNRESGIISIVDSESSDVVAVLNNPEELDLDFSDTHLYLGVTNEGPLPPKKDQLKTITKNKILGDLKKMMPDAFKLGRIEASRRLEERQNVDALSLYTALFQAIWSDNRTAAKDLVLRLVQLRDPLIASHVSYDW